MQHLTPTNMLSLVEHMETAAGQSLVTFIVCIKQARRLKPSRQLLSCAATSVDFFQLRGSKQGIGSTSPLCEKGLSLPTWVWVSEKHFST